MLRCGVLGMDACLVFVKCMITGGCLGGSFCVVGGLCGRVGFSSVDVCGVGVV